MAGGILSLQAVGIQDTYLTSNPEINVFKYKVYRYVNFATETQKLHLNDLATFGRKTSVIVPKKGHLLSKLYLHLKLPRLVKRDGSYVCWADALGYSIFSHPIELEIGGVVVDKLFPVCMDMRDELTSSTKKLGMDKMVLKSDTYRSNYYNAIKSSDMMIPLDFWFTKEYSSALPLLSMNNQEIKLNFQLKDFEDVINYDGILGAAPVSVLDSNVFAEYIFLDDIILDKFQKQKHMYIIEQTVYHGDENIPQGQSIFNTKINFLNPCKELLIACVDKNNFDNNNYFNYSRRSDGEPLVQELNLLLDGRSRFDDYLPEFIFREYFPNNVHSVIPTKHMYSIPFCTKPEESQPTGSINLSRFDDVMLSLKMNSANPECQVHIYGIMHNVVRIENGTLVFEWIN